ncbi:hypothetical protein GCM10009551_073200 [Nocardiopsis tropica]|uniref:hypothetical protein n=1 Tax=Tsukamurella strandjordii TaxID=147577 RepID=UPI0031DC9A33
MTDIAIAGLGVIPNATSYVASGARALTAALLDAGIDGDQLGLLINAGASRDMNISEPAVAALIQQEAGIHPAFDPDADTSILTFDLLNGGLSFGTAVSLIGDMIEMGDIEYGAVVVGDVHPSMNPFFKPNFPLVSDVFAAVIGPGDSTVLEVATPQRASDDISSEVYAELNGAGAGARSSVVVDLHEFDAGYFNAVSAAIGALSVDPTESVIVAPWPAASNPAFRTAFGEVDVRIVNPYERTDGKQYYTAAPVAALEHAHRAGIDTTVATVLAPSAPGADVSVVAESRIG